MLSLRWLAVAEGIPRAANTTNTDSSSWKHRHLLCFWCSWQFCPFYSSQWVVPILHNSWCHAFNQCRNIIKTPFPSLILIAHSRSHLQLLVCPSKNSANCCLLFTRALVRGSAVRAKFRCTLSGQSLFLSVFEYPANCLSARRHLK